MYFLLPTIVATAQALFIAGVQSQSYTPWLDGKCTVPVKSVTVNGIVQTDLVSTFETPGIPATKFWLNPVFENASSPTSGSGSNIWWSVGEQDPGCGVALMQGYSQLTYGRLPFVAPSGNVIMYGNSPGCYYSEIPAEVQLSGSFCCGTADCSALTGGNSGLTKRAADYNPLPALGPEPVSQSEIIPRAANLESKSNPFGRRGLSARASPLNLTTCQITTSGGGYASAGKQTLVANTQSCAGGSCSFAISHGLTVSTALSTSTDTTITNTVGASILITTGVDLIASADVTTGTDFSFAKAVAESTGTTITNGTTVTVTNNLGQEPGTQAFVTFTPTYNCWSVAVDCGTPSTGNLDFCQPALGGGGDGLQGDYTVVYI